MAINSFLVKWIVGGAGLVRQKITSNKSINWEIGLIYIYIYPIIYGAFEWT